MTAALCWRAGAPRRRPADIKRHWRPTQRRCMSATGTLKNANSICLNGQALDRDLAALLQRPVRIANDANCLALSEATDGAGAGAAVVFAVIIGTGTGAGIAVHGR